MHYFENLPVCIFEYAKNDINKCQKWTEADKSSKNYGLGSVRYSCCAQVLPGSSRLERLVTALNIASSFMFVNFNMF